MRFSDNILIDNLPLRERTVGIELKQLYYLKLAVVLGVFVSLLG